MLITDIIPALSISWGEIGALVTTLALIISFMWHNNERFNKKANITYVEAKIQQLKDENTVSHAEIRADNDKYLSMVQKEAEVDREAVKSQLDLILEVVKRIDNKKK